MSVCYCAKIVQTACYNRCERKGLRSMQTHRSGTRNQTNKKKKMAQLKDLLKDVPAELSRKAVEYELLRRKNASYLKRVGELRAEEHVFDRCKQARPNKGKAKNRFSREEAGTIGTITMGIRTGKNSVCVCKSQNKW